MADITPTVPTTPVVGGFQPAQQPRRQPDYASSGVFRRIYSKTIIRGSLVSFKYLYWKHDPSPLLLCSGIYGDGRVSGVDLNYLTFRYVKTLIATYAGKNFAYSYIKGNSFIGNAFRTYKKSGMTQLRMLDRDYLMKVLGMVRSYRPTEVEAIRQEVQKQLRQKMNPTADELANEYTEIVAPTVRPVGQVPTIDGRTNPTNITPI